MSALNWIMGIIAFLACAGAVYVILEQPTFFATKQTPSLSMFVPITIEVGKPFDVQIEGVHHEGETLTLTLDETLYQHTCETDPCSFVTSLTIQKQGDYTLFLQSSKQYAQLPIHVSLKTIVCIDGTLNGECSTSSPSHRCINQELVADCSTCGCPTELICSQNACIAPLHSFTIHVEPPTAFYTTAEAPVGITLTNTSTFTSNGFFLLYVDAYDAGKQLLKSFPQQLSLDELEVNGTQSVSIPVQLPSTTKQITVRLFKSTTEKPESQFITESTPTPVSVQTDSTPPSPPHSLTYHTNGGNYTLAWNASPSNDVSTYVIYQQNLATGGFTTYSILAQTSILTYDLPPDAEGKAYTVKAMDAAGNQSDAVQPVFVS